MSEITRREFVGAVGAALAASPSALSAAPPARQRPNVLFICSDTHQADACGFRGHPLVRTPHLDRLARQGTHFTTCYCGAPLCVPARASLFTGMFPSDVDSWCNATVFRGQVPTWGACLRDRGYHCLATGKMDLSGSGDLGFEEVLTKHEHSQSPDVTALFRRPLCFRVGEREAIDGRGTQRTHKDEPVLQAALSFLADKAPTLAKPWALYVGFVAPLPRFVVEQRYFDMYPVEKIPLPNIPAGYLESLPLPWEASRAYKRIATPIAEDRVRRARAAYFGLITGLDERVGRLLDQLERTGQRDNTLVVYTTDHGQSMGEHGLWFHNEPTDCSSRVPLILAGPGIPAGARVDTPVMHVDLFPTLLEAAGAPPPTAAPPAATGGLPAGVLRHTGGQAARLSDSTEVVGGSPKSTRGTPPRPPGLRGHSLLPLCQGRAGDHPGFAYSECHAEGTCSGSFIIRKGPWKYIHYTYYDDLLFNIEEDPEELKDVIHSRRGQKVAAELHDVLLLLVDPTARTEAAFARQEQMLADLCQKMSLEELLAFGFEKRLGRGQAITLLKKYKR